MGFSAAVGGLVPLADACAMADDLLRQPDSAVARAVNDDDEPWTRDQFLLTHLWTVHTGKPHPGLPKIRKHIIRDPKRQTALNAARRRARQRQQRIDAGEIK